MSDLFLNGRAELHSGDCLKVMPTLDVESFDSVICDPPYHLTSIVKRFGGEGAAEAKSNGATGVYRRASAGFMGKRWDGGDIAFDPDTWRECSRLLKPGGHLLAFGAPKNFGFMQVAIAEAGFEVRDVLCWLFGTGFPKSHSVANKLASWLDYGEDGDVAKDRIVDEWEGWGTALKPAYEPIILARKPLGQRTVAANVLAHGTGAINIDACRVDAERPTGWGGGAAGGSTWNETNSGLCKPGDARPVTGRWPANVVHDGSADVVDAFPQSKSSRSTVTSKPGTISVNGAGLPSHTGVYGFDDAGSAARFFYCAKATAADRIGSKHPTVKPIALMQWLIRMVTPKGGLILDPFAGTGVTAEAALIEGMRCVMIEAEYEYQMDIRRRMALMLAGPEERERAILKARGLVDLNAGPLFANDNVATEANAA